MRPNGPTFWRLGGLSGWQERTAAAADLTVSDARGLQLAAAPGGLLSLNSEDGSLGGLTLPRGLALDGSLLLYLLGQGGAWVKRWDPEAGAFVELAEVGGAGSEPRRLSNAASIAIAQNRLYVADTGNARVQVFELRMLMLEAILSVPGWSPVDLAAQGGGVYILDRARGRVYRHAPAQELALVFERPERAGQWSRIAVDRLGKVYLLNASDTARPVLEEGDPAAPPIPDAGAIRDRFAPSPIRMDQEGHFTLPACLARRCARSVPKPPDCHPKAQIPHLVRVAQGAWLLYVVRRAERRLDAYTQGACLRHSWGAAMDWQPADVATCGECAYVLDEQNQTLYRHCGGTENLVRLELGDTASRHWSQVACDALGLVYLYAPGETAVQVFEGSGQSRGERAYAGVAALFAAPRPAEPAAVTDQSFDSTGRLVPLVGPEASDAPLYRTAGSWQSQPLSSKVYQCQWHCIELELTQFPPGSRISVSTCAHDKPEDVRNPTVAHFVEATSLVAPLEQPVCPERRLADFLVQSGPGEYLTVRITLEGDGFSTPAVEVARIHYPRDSYLQYLPATYSADDESRAFLERFLAIFQTEWDRLEQTLDQSERYFDPDAVPEGPFLEYLARQWVGLSLEGNWTGAQKRRLLSAVPKLCPHRGQPAALRDFVAVYLANLAGLETAEVRALGFPMLVEGFRERQYLFASAGAASALGVAGPLWSASFKRRLQLGVYSTEGQAALVSVGDPEHDVFNQHAHRFRVYVPAAWVQTSAQESMLRRGLDTEKPAHTQYDLCLVEGRFRLEAQSTVGLDTIIGEAPALRLACAGCSCAAPSRPPAGRLGYDTVLWSSAGAVPGALGIAGKDTVLG